MSEFKYYKALNLFESFYADEIEEAEQVRTPTRDLANRLGELFQTNFPLLKSIMNRMSVMSPEELQAKIPSILNAIKHYTPGEADPMDVFRSLNKVLDEGTQNAPVRVPPPRAA